MGYNDDFKIPHYLVSYADLLTRSAQNRWFKFYFANPDRSKNMELFLDSGAFSAYHSGVPVTLAGFIDFVMKYGKHFSVIAALDAMYDPEKSLANYRDMVRMGLDTVIPTYHYPEPWSYLERYCKLTDYVAIGGTGKLNPMLLRSVIEKIFSIVPKTTKIHLFGMTTLSMMRRYGHLIESVDSSSWLTGAKFAAMYTRSGKYISFAGRGLTNKDAPRLLQYNVRRFQEMEEDINNSVLKNKLLVQSQSQSGAGSKKRDSLLSVGKTSN